MSRGLQKYGGKSNEVPVYVCSLLSVYSADRRRTPELKCRFRKIFSRLSNGWSMFLANYHRAGKWNSPGSGKFRRPFARSRSYVRRRFPIFFLFFVAKTCKLGKGRATDIVEIHFFPVERKYRGYGSTFILERSCAYIHTTGIYDPI